MGDLSYVQIGLEQGLEMLRIFKTFAEETSLLEDYNFYEKREQSVEARKLPAPQTEMYGNHDSPVSVCHLAHHRLKSIGYPIVFPPLFIIMI